MAPRYEYECLKGHQFETYESIDAPTERDCDQPRCRALARRVMSLTNVNVDAVMKPGDAKYTPPMSHYLGRRRWQKRQDKDHDDRKASKNPVTI